MALILLADAAKALRASESDLVAREARAVASAADELGEFDPTRFLDCFGTEKALAERFRIAQWRTGATKIGITTHVDFFARRFGFSPDGKELPGGQVKSAQARFDFSRQRGRGQWTIGMGGGAVRQDFKGDYSVTLTPAVSASSIAFSLTGTLAAGAEGGSRGETVDVIRVEDGKVPPHAVIGFLAKAGDRAVAAETQTTHFNAFEAQAFIEFKIRGEPVLPPGHPGARGAEDARGGTEGDAAPAEAEQPAVVGADRDRDGDQALGKPSSPLSIRNVPVV